MALTWLSQKQPCTALSSTEAEYNALLSAARKAIWICELLLDTGLRGRKTVPVRCDNTSAILIAKNAELHTIGKQILLRHNFIREKVQLTLIELLHILTAVGLTKALTRRQLIENREKMGIGPLFEPENEDTS